MNYEKYFEMSYDEQQDKIDRDHKALTKGELEIVNAIEMHMTKIDYPIGFFENNSLDELNDQFSGLSIGRITKKIADYLSLVHAHVIEMDEMVEGFADDDLEYDE